MSHNSFFFVGSSKSPYFMLEIDKENHKIIISRPDKHSLNIKNFFEKYYLGEILYEIKYEKIIYSEDNLKDYTKLDGKMGEGSLLLSECIIKTKNKYLWIKDDIYERDI